MIPYTPETAAYQAGIIETTADIGGEICDAIEWQEGQNREIEISIQENNAPSGEGGTDDKGEGNNEDDKN